MTTDAPTGVAEPETAASPEAAEPAVPQRPENHLLEPVSFRDIIPFPHSGIIAAVLRDFVQRYLNREHPTYSASNFANTVDPFNPRLGESMQHFRTLFFAWLSDPETEENVNALRLSERRDQICDELALLAPALSPGNHMNPDFRLKFQRQYPPDSAEYDPDGPGYDWGRLATIMHNLALYLPEQTEALLTPHLGGWLFLNPRFVGLCRFLLDVDKEDIQARRNFVEALLH
jgi:hypothetical protein